MAKKNRKHIRFDDDPRADKYYESRASSAINNANAVARKGKLNAPLTAIQTLPYVADDADTNKYYSANGSPTQRRRAGLPRVVHPNRPPKPGKGGAYSGVDADVVRPLIVRGQQDVRSAVEKIVALLKSGQSKVLVQVATEQLRLNLDTALSLRIARQEITEDQYRDVAFRPLPTDNKQIADEIVGVLDPSSVPHATEPDADDMPADFAAFVKGDTETTEATPPIPPAISLADDTDD